jgi:hypothetical protein
VIDQFCPSWIPRWWQGEWLRAKKDTWMEAGCQAFLLLLANSWAQIGSQQLSAKAGQGPATMSMETLHWLMETMVVG